MAGLDRRANRRRIRFHNDIQSRNCLRSPIATKKIISSPLNASLISRSISRMPRWFPLFIEHGHGAGDGKFARRIRRYGSGQAGFVCRSVTGLRPPGKPGGRRSSDRLTLSSTAGLCRTPSDLLTPVIASPRWCLDGHRLPGSGPGIRHQRAAEVRVGAPLSAIVPETAMPGRLPRHRFCLPWPGRGTRLPDYRDDRALSATSGASALALPSFLVTITEVACPGGGKGSSSIVVSVPLPVPVKPEGNPNSGG